MDFKDFDKKSAQEILRWAGKRFGQRAGLASSFGMEDMVLIDMLAQLDDTVTVLTLDTGRLHEETYETMERVRSKYGIRIQTFFPVKADVERLVRDKGFFSFRENVDDRKECCPIRKLEPLKRALSKLDAWITGLRREQSVTRTDVPKVAEDPDRASLIKINPLADWTLAQVEEYIQKNNVPINPLHRKNYPSIGCAPCTRPIEPGEDVRAGRWWWEGDPEAKECGIHIVAPLEA